VVGIVGLCVLRKFGIDTCDPDSSELISLIGWLRNANCSLRYC